MREIAKKVNVSAASVWRILREHRAAANATAEPVLS